MTTPKHTSLSRRKPQWHAEAATTLQQNVATIHAAFLDATNKAVWLGFFLISVKARGKDDGSIPHGQFRAWVKENVPGVAYDTISQYMFLGRNVIEKASLQITDFPFFARGGNLSSLEILTLPSSELPKGIAQIRDRVDQLIAGKSQHQLCLDFRQSAIGNDEECHIKRGNLSGKGCTKAHRAAAQAAEDEARLTELTLSSEDTAKWLLENADHKRIGALDDPHFAALLEAIETARGYMLAVQASRKGLQS